MFNENTSSFNIGNLFLMDAGVTQDQLSEALAKQEKAPHRKLGEILVAMGALTTTALDAALNKQANWRRKGPSSEDARKLSEFALSDTERMNDEIASIIGDIPKAAK